MLNNWYVITGGPSTGKTTLLNQLNKLGYATVPEAARTLIDASIANGLSLQELRRDEKVFQVDVLRLKEATENKLAVNDLTFFDRGMQDTLAYLNFYNFEVEEWVSELMQTSKYKKVFLLEPLPQFETDYSRVEDKNFTEQLHLLLFNAYNKFGMKPVSVPYLSIDERLKFILDRTERLG